MSLHLRAVNNYEQRVRRFVSHLVLALLLLSLCRIAFYFFNQAFFKGVDLSLFVSGVRFDLATLFWILQPFFILGLIDWVYPLPKWGSTLRKVLFQLGIGGGIFFNCIDIEYFRFTQKRSTADLFSWVTTGDDLYTLLPQFLSDFWYLILLFIAFMTFSIWGYNRIEQHVFKTEPQQRHWIQRATLTLFMAAFIFIGGRGGLQLIPISVVDAGLYTSAQNVPLVLNTPFTIIRTVGKKELKKVDYFSQQELKGLYSPIHSNLGSVESFEKKNVAIIILESFSMEFAGDDAKSKKLTPFLQSLKYRSIYMNHCFANGKKSIEALPAILSGVPTLMNDPLINSSYSLNNIESFASYLKPHGYTSTFFHGGKNGTMNFNGFINAAQFDAYFGKDEYANDADYDGTWGIYDEAFLQYFCKTLTETKKPFITSVFTLSSHHPYSIPKEYAGKFTEGETPLEKTVQYTDLSLKKFFESAEKQTWYKNTVFVITADHTPYTTTPEFLTNYGMYHIPLLLFDPSADSSYTLAKTCQQIDILPTVLDYINFPDSVFSFGQSVFASNPGFAIQYINNQHQIIEDSSLLIMNRGIPISYFSPSTDRLLNNNIINQNSPPQQQSSRRLQAIVQDYNARMIDNKLTVAQ